MKSLFRTGYILVFMILGFSQCSLPEEETEESISVELIIPSLVPEEDDLVTNYSFPKYFSVENDTSVFITAFNESQDSMFIKIGKNPGVDLLVGNYVINESNGFNTVYLKTASAGEYAIANGELFLSYVNRRLDFTFGGITGGNIEIRNGVLENILRRGASEGVVIGGEQTGVTNPNDPPTPQGVISYDLNGTGVTYSADQTNATEFNGTLLIQADDGTSEAQITFEAVGPDFPNSMADLVGIDLGESGSVVFTVNTNNSSYGSAGGGEFSFLVTSFNTNNNTIDAEFSGDLNKLNGPDNLPNQVTITNGIMDAVSVVN